MAPHPYRWTDLLPSRPVLNAPSLRTVTDIPYSWTEPGWDLDQVSDTGSMCDEDNIWQENDNG